MSKTEKKKAMINLDELEIALILLLLQLCYNFYDLFLQIAKNEDL